MTERLTSPEPRRETCALLLIDFQRDFCKAGGYADRFDGGVGWAVPALAAAKRLLSAARDAALLIVHTREGYAADLSDCTLQRRIRSREAGAEIGSAGPLGRLLIRGEPGHDFVASVAPRPGEVVIDKASYGAFVAPQLETLLRHRAIEHLFFSGVTADVCVHTTLREATDRGYFCHYVRDAIATFDPVLQAACERMVQVEGGIWGRLVESDRVIADWGEFSADHGSGRNQHRG